MGGFEVNPNISSRHVWVGFKLCNPNLTNDACFFLLFSHMYYFNLLFRWFFPTRMISILRQVMGDDWFTQPGSTTVTKAILHHAAWSPFKSGIFTGDFFWERNKNHSPNWHLKIWNPYNFTMKSILYCNFSL